MGPTGFDRMLETAYKHAGSWDESLERWSYNILGESNYAMAA